MNRKNSSASCRKHQKNSFLFILKLAEVWLKDGRGIDDQEERMKNKKYRSVKMFPSDIIQKCKNIVIFFQNNKLLKLKYTNNNGEMYFELSYLYVSLYGTESSAIGIKTALNSEQTRIRWKSWNFRSFLETSFCSLKTTSHLSSVWPVIFCLFWLRRSWMFCQVFSFSRFNISSSPSSRYGNVSAPRRTCPATLLSKL